MKEICNDQELIQSKAKFHHKTPGEKQIMIQREHIAS